MVTNYKKYAAASDAVKTFALTVRGISGYFNGAVNSYLLFFDAKAVPTNGTIPLRGFPIYPSAPFAQPWTEEFEVSNGLVWAVSTTLAALNISAETVDVFIEVDSAYDDTGTSTAGDYTTGTETLQVWTDAAGPKRLHRVIFTVLSSLLPVQYGMVFAHDGPTDGDKPLAVIPLLAPGTTTERFFGRSFSPMSKTSANVIRDGCTICVSSSPTQLVLAGTNDYAIKATYK